MIRIPGTNRRHTQYLTNSSKLIPVLDSNGDPLINVVDSDLIWNGEVIYTNEIGAVMLEVNPVIPLVFGSYNIVYFGENDVALAAVNVSSAEHDALKAQSDVISFPADINKKITQAVINSTTTQLESLNIPVDWLKPSLTYKQILKRFMRIFRVFVRVQKRFPNKTFKSGLVLSKKLNELSQETKTSLESIANEFNTDLTNKPGSMPVRVAIKLLMDSQQGNNEGLRGLDDAPG